MTFSTEDADRIYNIGRWGNGHFVVNKEGNLSVLPNKQADGPKIVIKDIIEEIKKEGLQFPVVIRFQDILRYQVTNLNKTFQKVIEKASFQGNYYGVFPIKVNQMREVIEEVVEAGKPFNYGLEAGSKPELLTVLAYNTNKESLTILNGYKDRDFLRLALLGRQLGRKVIVVVEKFSELIDLIELSQEMDVDPIIGIKAKLETKGAGRWVSSSGDNSKFGLTFPELLMAVNYLKEKDMLHCFKLFHFHIGSQIIDIRAIKEAITEAARAYCQLRKLGASVEYFDVGGGVGVDYNGTKSLNNSSMNYDLMEYIQDVVYTLKEVCDLEDIDHPHIVSETGRAVVAPHSCVITNVFGNSSTKVNMKFPIDKSPGEQVLVSNMREIFEDLSNENFQEVYNDATQKKQEILSAFNLGILTLEDRAKAEVIYWRIIDKVKDYIKAEDPDTITEDLKQVEEELADNYLCNFSVFQSILDSWAVGQLIPVSPICSLNERPTRKAILSDITCDSDGKIDKFIDYKGSRPTLPVHELKEGEDYFMGLFLTGAYQDVMGDYHNLFGRLNEVHVYHDDQEPSGFYIEEIIHGQSARDVLSIFQYSPEFMASTLKRQIDKQVQRKKLRPREGVKLTDFYEQCLRDYTYLKNNHR